MKRILDDAHERARAVLEGQTDLLERIAQALLERETLNHVEIKLLAEGKPLPPLEKLIIPGAPSNGTPLDAPLAPAAEPEPEVPDGGEDEGAEGHVSPLAHALDRKGSAGEEEGDPSDPVHIDGQEELPLPEPDSDRAP